MPWTKWRVRVSLLAMDRRPLGSSVVVEVGYDADGQVLEVAFASGKIYRYLDVPEIVHRRLLTARSAGELFNTEIRDHYRSERVDR